MILYNNIVKISKNRWIGYMLKVAFLLASSISNIIVLSKDDQSISIVSLSVWAKNALNRVCQY